MLSEYIVLIIISSFPSDISESLLANQVYGAILSKIVTFILCTVTIIFYNKKRSSYNVQYSILILIMPVVSIILLLTIPFRTDLTPLQSELSIIGIGGLLFANIINYYLLDNIIRVQELKRNESNLTNQINLQIDKYRQISVAYRNSRSIVHDVKKQYFYINECISKNDTGKLQEFINRSISELEASAARVNTGNLVIDSFVSNHMTLAERSGIKFDTRLQIDLTRIKVPDYDLCIILGNLLDNSYKAAVAIEPPYDKRINVEIFNSSLEFVIHIYNTVGPDVSDSYDDDEDEELYHGYGTTNVGRITRKYYGTYTHYIEKGWYHAIVSIPIIDDKFR